MCPWPQLNLHKLQTTLNKPLVTCSSVPTFSSSRPRMSRTSCGGRARNSSDFITSLKCFWRYLLAESTRLEHMYWSAKVRTPRQLVGWSLKNIKTNFMLINLKRKKNMWIEGLVQNCLNYLILYNQLYYFCTPSECFNKLCC